MNLSRICRWPVALALGAAATAALADRYVVYNDVYARAAPVEVVRVERVAPVEVVAYNERHVSAAPVVVERNYSYVAPRETIVVQAEPVYTATYVYDWRHPQWGHHIDRGLFNRRGPNDFGR